MNTHTCAYIVLYLRKLPFNAIYKPAAVLFPVVWCNYTIGKQSYLCAHTITFSLLVFFFFFFFFYIYYIYYIYIYIISSFMSLFFCVYRYIILHDDFLGVYVAKLCVKRYFVLCQNSSLKFRVLYFPQPVPKQLQRQNGGA